MNQQAIKQIAEALEREEILFVGTARVPRLE
jgi:hypothetical protein